jgi:hypothetical protein
VFVVAELLAFSLIVEQGDSYDFRQITTTDTYFLQTFLTLFAGALLLGGLVGFYARQSEAAGRLGFVGFSSAFFGTILVVGSFYAATLVAPMVAMEAPALPLSLTAPSLASCSYGRLSVSRFLRSLVVARGGHLESSCLLSYRLVVPTRWRAGGFGSFPAHQSPLRDSSSLFGFRPPDDTTS